MTKYFKSIVTIIMKQVNGNNIDDLKPCLSILHYSYAGWSKEWEGFDL